MLREMAQKAHDTLDRVGVDYFVIGRMAVPAWGEPVASRDIDLVLVLEKEKINKLLVELKKEGFKFEHEKVREKLGAGKPAKLRYEEPYSLDLRVATFTIDRQALKRALSFEIFGREWKVAPPEELILYKLGSMKARDIEDIKSILKNPNLKLDWNRMEELANTLSKEYSQDFKERFKKLKTLY